MNESLLSLAFMTGLLGSGHCLGMCGGLVAACALTSGRGLPGLFSQMFYHFGRIFTYTTIGVFAGWIGSAICLTDALSSLTRFVLIGSDLFIITVGLSSAGMLPLPNFLDYGPHRAANLFSKFIRKCSIMSPAARALPLGLILGLLPCGYVYTLAITAAQSGSALMGGMIMLAFGLGTAPALMLFGTTTQWFTTRTRLIFLRLAGVIVVLIGIINLVNHTQLLVKN